MPKSTAHPDLSGNRRLQNPLRPGSLDSAYISFIDHSTIDYRTALTFRWYYGNRPVAKVSDARLSLRRRLSNARNSHHY